VLTEAAVLVEPAVLDGDLGLLHDRCDLVERDDDPVLVVRGGDDAALGVEDPRLLGQRGRAELARQRVEHVHTGTRDSPRRPDGGHDEPGPQQPHDQGSADERPQQGDDARDVGRSPSLHAT
jgi:hypothetical protein